MPPPALLDPDEFPTEVVADAEAIERVLPQRHEMRQLDAITMVDTGRQLIVGYKDVGSGEFWVRGHMPGHPLLPGVLMCEAGAQLCSYYGRKAGVVSGDFIGFGGMDEVRFRGPVVPGDRLWLVGYTPKHSQRRMLFEVQGFVDGKLVFQSKTIGIPMRNEAMQAAGSQ